MSEPSTRPVEDPKMTQPPAPESNEGSDPAVSENVKDAYGAHGQVEEEPAEPRRS
jgi:hypothetical protein